MGLTLNVISRELGLLPELIPKKLKPLISSLAIVDLSASLPAGGKSSCCLYWESSSKMLFVFLLLFEYTNHNKPSLGPRNGDRTVAPTVNILAVMSHHRKTFPHLTRKIGRLAEAKRMAGAIWRSGDRGHS